MMANADVMTVTIQKRVVILDSNQQPFGQFHKIRKSGES